MTVRPARSSISADDVSLPSSRAFLVQFAGGSPNPDGRAEHLATGEAIHFDSWVRLQQFLEGQLEKEPS
jgi:hypothetical protein